MKTLQFRKMRRSDKELSLNEASEILKNASYGVLSTVGIDGMPYGIPVNYTYENNCIFFHCATTGHKLDNLSQNPNVSFCVVESSKVIPESFSTIFRSAIAFGRASILEDDGEKTEALMKLLSKYSADYVEDGVEEIKNALKATCVMRIDILHLTGKSSMK